jgi:hypothetical protein
MGRGFKESAHLKTDLKKYHENFDAIDWGNLRDKKEEKREDDANAPCSDQESSKDLENAR